MLIVFIVPPNGSQRPKKLDKPIGLNPGPVDQQLAEAAKELKHRGYTVRSINVGQGRNIVAYVYAPGQTPQEAVKAPVHVWTPPSRIAPRAK